MMTRVDVDDVARLRVALARTARWLDRHSRGAELTRTQVSVLGSTARLGPVGLGELAEVEGINPTMLSRIVGKLDDAGYLRRLPDPSDRRAARVEITEAGREQHLLMRAQRTELLRERIESLPAAQRRALLAAVPALEALQATVGVDEECP